MVKSRKVVKCPGRFSELREYLYNEVFPAVIEDRTTITEDDLYDMWDLIENDVYRFDLNDPYYDVRNDSLRELPVDSPLSLLPLIEHPHYGFDSSNIVEKYALRMGNDEALAKNLALTAKHPKRLLQDVLGKEPRDLHIPTDNGGDVSLGGYFVSGNSGIGTISPGGVKGGGIRSDSPFLLEVYKQNGGESDLVSVIGFWAQNNSMLVSQMQSCRNATFPEDVQFGVGSLRVAEVVAQGMGFNSIVAYSARGHPIFKEHPGNWKQFGKDFVCVWDGSSKKLGYDGGRNGDDGHKKDLG